MSIWEGIKSAAIAGGCAACGLCCCDHPSADHVCAFCFGVFCFKAGLEFSDWWYGLK